jgi:hypothetical protein
VVASLAVTHLKYRKYRVLRSFRVVAEGLLRWVRSVPDPSWLGASGPSCRVSIGEDVHGRSVKPGRAHGLY